MTDTSNITPEARAAIIAEHEADIQRQRQVTAHRHAIDEAAGRLDAEILRIGFASRAPQCPACGTPYREQPESTNIFDWSGDGEPGLARSCRNCYRELAVPADGGPVVDPRPIEEQIEWLEAACREYERRFGLSSEEMARDMVGGRTPERLKPHSMWEAPHWFVRWQRLQALRAQLGSSSI